MKTTRDSVDKYLLAVLLVSVTIYGFFYNSFSAVLMDESAYMLSAKAVLDGKGYIMWIIAPMFTYILATFYFMFGFSELAAKVVAPTFAVLSTVAMYYLAKEFFDSKRSAIAASVLATLPAFMVLGERVMTETPYIFFFTLSLLFFVRAVEKDKKYLPLVFASFIISFLIKYSAVLLLLPFALYFIVANDGKEKLKNVLLSRWLLASIVLGMVLMIPMFFYSQSLFENPIKLFLAAFSTYNIPPDEPWYFYMQAFPLIAAATLPFVFYATYVAVKSNDKKMLWAFLSLLSLVLYRLLFLAVRETRYLIDTVPFLALLTAFAFLSFKFDRKIKLLLVIMLIAINSIGGIYAINTVANDPKYVDMKSAAEWAEDNCESPVLTNIIGPLKYYYIDTKIEVAGIPEVPTSASNYGCIIYGRRASVVEELESWEPTITFGNVLIFKK